MNWISNVVRPKIRSILRREVPENLWVKCPETGQLVFYKDLEANQFVIPTSNYHMRMSALARLRALFDDGEFEDIPVPEVAADPLKFRDERRYADRLKDARGKTGLDDAVKLGFGRLEGLPVTAGVQDFDFLGGSLGMAAGEAVIAGLATAVKRATPFILFAASAGAGRDRGADRSRLVNATPERDEFSTPVDAILARLLSLHPKRIDLSLDRVLRLLARLGHPERRLPPVVHVGGTNGKGSTIAFLRAILEAAGRRVHVYTSPHLVRVNERFRLGRPDGGVLVSDEQLAEVLAACERANAGAPITVFEITTAAGLLLFAGQPADVLLLEVGLGGRLDATNVVESPAATVITSVSLDHVEYLGDSIVKIAAEKAGILKSGVPAVIAPQPDEARGVIERQAARLGARLMVAGEHWLVSQEHGRLVYQDEHGLLDLPQPRLFGRHQLDNAGTAIATLRSLADANIV